MRTKEAILKTINNRKSGLTSEQIAEKLYMKKKTVRNRLCEMKNDGLVNVYDYYKTNSNGNYVYSYVAMH